jgi:basic membrane protein A
MKKLFSVIAVLVLASMLIPACTPTAPDCTKPDVFCVGLVTDVGKVDDKSFNQTAWEGVQKAKTDGVANWVQYIETMTRTSPPSQMPVTTKSSPSVST